MSPLKFASDFLPTGLGAAVSCFPGFWLWIQERKGHLLWPSWAGLHDTLSRQQQPQPALQQPLHSSAGHQTTCAWQNVSRAEILLPLGVYLGLSNLIMFPCWAQAMPEEGVKTLPSTTTELVKSNTASSRAPVKDWKCHQEQGWGDTNWQAQLTFGKLTGVLGFVLGFFISCLWSRGSKWYFMASIRKSLQVLLFLIKASSSTVWEHAHTRRIIYTGTGHTELCGKHM